MKTGTIRSWTPEEEMCRARLYPCDVEDAMPEAEMSWWLTVYVVLTLRRVAVRPEEGSVHGNMPIYYVEGRPEKHVSPDVFYVPGVPFSRHRRSYRLWETGIPPRVVFEIVSIGYEKKDVVANRRLYEEIRVEEYYWFQPQKRILTAFRLDPARGVYVEAEPNADGRYWSPALGLEVGLESDLLGLYQEGRYIPPPEDLVAETEGLLEEKEEILAEMTALLGEKDERIAEKDERIAEKDERIRELEREIERLRGEG